MSLNIFRSVNPASDTLTPVLETLHAVKETTTTDISHLATAGSPANSSKMANRHIATNRETATANGNAIFVALKIKIPPSTPMAPDVPSRSVSVIVDCARRALQTSGHAPRLPTSVDWILDASTAPSGISGIEAGLERPADTETSGGEERIRSIAAPSSPPPTTTTGSLLGPDPIRRGLHCTA
jgi:hypothetical protein